jgi:NAD-dependent SIR2 family protein deacetylase
MMIKTVDISFTIDRKQILKNVTAEFKPGEFNMILGPNGSGKSSFLKIFSGELDKYEGSVYYNDKIIKARQSIDDAQYILIGGGAGLSDAAGIHYSGKRFKENYTPFIERYGIKDMYSAGFYPFKTQEEKWAYWSKHILINRYEPPALKIYKDLLELIRNKNYFVITTNVDYQFYKAGFSKDRIFATQGDYGKLQCAVGCHDKLYDNEIKIRNMVDMTNNCKTSIIKSFILYMLDYTQ